MTMTLERIIKFATKHLPLLKVLTLAWMFLIALLCIIPPDDFPETGGIPHLDKFVHFALYVVFTFMSLFVFSGSKQPQRIHFILLPGIFIFSLWIEVMQGVLPLGRSFSLIDLVANLSGIITGLLLFRRIRYLLTLSQQ